MATRAQIIAKAREFIGTPFQHQARIKSKGVDCVGVVLCVGEELGVVCQDGRPLLGNQYTDYGMQPAGTRVLEICIERLVRKNIAEMKPGDIVCMRTPTDPTHVGIITSYGGVLYIVHAYDSPSFKMCKEHILDEKWRRRIVGVFEFPGTVD
jgi:cell wall-associated NlpC family hydrolase